MPYQSPPEGGGDARVYAVDHRMGLIHIGHATQVPRASRRGRAARARRGSRAANRPICHAATRWPVGHILRSGLRQGTHNEASTSRGVGLGTSAWLHVTSAHVSCSEPAARIAWRSRAAACTRPGSGSHPGGVAPSSASAMMSRSTACSLSGRPSHAIGSGQPSPWWHGSRASAKASSSLLSISLIVFAPHGVCCAAPRLSIRAGEQHGVLP